MSNQTVTKEKITVHGRGSVIIDYKVQDADGAQIDISGWDIWFEVDGIPIREVLVPDTGDPLGQLIVLERDQVETLKTSPCKFAVIDESNRLADIFRVLWTGTINRDGYVGEPDTVAG
jgi:hypothetical protein